MSKHIRRYPATVAVLIEKGLRDPDDIVRELSALTLSHSGNKACVTPLIKMAKRVVTQLDAAAHRGLSLWTLEAQALPEAVLALGRLAATAKPALPMLDKQIRTGKPRARAAAAWAIYQISGDSGPAATVLAQLAQYCEIAPRDKGFPAREDAVRQFALNTLGPIGRSVATAAPSVRTLLDSGDTRTRACAVGALLRMGVADAQVVRTARELFKGTEHEGCAWSSAAWSAASFKASSYRRTCSYCQTMLAQTCSVRFGMRELRSRQLRGMLWRSSSTSGPTNSPSKSSEAWARTPSPTYRKSRVSSMPRTLRSKPTPL